MIDADQLYSEYVKSNPNVVGATGGGTCPQDKFVKIASVAAENPPVVAYGRKRAEKEMRVKIRKSMGLIEYFILRAIIGWIVTRILNYYFLSNDPQ